MKSRKRGVYVLYGVFLVTIVALMVVYVTGITDPESKGIILSTYEQCVDTDCECGHVNKKGEVYSPRWVKREDLLTDKIFFIHQCGACCPKCRMNVRPISSEYLMNRGIINNPVIDIPYKEYPYPTEFIFR